MRTPPSPIASPSSRRRWISGPVLAGLLLATACSETGLLDPPHTPTEPSLQTNVAAASGGTLVNGSTATDDIAAAGETDTWSFTATQGDYIGLGIGEVSGTTDFTPWIRLIAPDGALVGNSWNAAAAQIGVNASLTGTYTVLAASGDSNNDGTGVYRLTLSKAPGTIVVDSTDQGGAMKNGATHPGNLYVGDLDTWKFTANQGDYIALGVGEVSGTTDFTPWIRLIAPNGALVGNSWNAAAAQISVNASQAGTYTVIVSTADSGNDGTGNYRITSTRVPGAFVVDSTDQGGAMTKGVAHTGSILVGELDTWSFAGSQGGTITLSITETSGSADFTPWIRLVGPNGALLGNSWNAATTQINVVAPQGGTYAVLVGTADSGNDATGTYQLSVTGSGVAP
jgi:trimeric autotransporter adhesin